MLYRCENCKTKERKRQRRTHLVNPRDQNPKEHQKTREEMGEN